MSSTSTDRVDGLSASVSIKAPVKVATTANITLSGEQTIDGVAVEAFEGFQVSTITEDDRVLVKNQTTSTQNGIYVVRTGTWLRAKDFDGSRDVATGTLVPVQSGTYGAKTYWRLTTSSNPIVFGTDNITFEPAGQFWSNNVVALGSISGAQTINLNYGSVFTMTLTAATALTVSNWPSTGTYREALLIITNGDNYVTWPSGTKFAQGSEPTLTTSGTDWLLICSHDGGTTPHVFTIALNVGT